jgi:hypothetical protein
MGREWTGREGKGMEGKGREGMEWRGAEQREGLGKKTVSRVSPMIAHPYDCITDQDATVMGCGYKWQEGKAPLMLTPFLLPSFFNNSLSSSSSV